jgi:MOSC domain-containing protein YiiM
MRLVEQVTITAGAGLDGDHKGGKFPRRGVTMLAREAWAEAIAALGDLAGEVPLPWTTRRANLLVEGVALPRAAGALLRVGPVLLEVTAQTVPCARMDEAHPGLRKALSPDWRGGVTCRVLEGGLVAIGGEVAVLLSPPERRIRLPG